MASGYAAKRTISLSLNTDLVSKVTALDKNLSGVVERLLAKFLKEQEAALGRAIKHWNDFDAKHGSFPDEYIDL